MSIAVKGGQAQVHWLSDKHDGGCLTDGQMILYVTEDPDKLGMAGAESYVGLSPTKVFERRYATMKSAMNKDFIANDIIVINKADCADADPDNGVRRLINSLYKKGLCPFDANVGTFQQKNTNSEALIGYNRELHLEILLNITKQYLGIGYHFDTKVPVDWRYMQAEDASLITYTLKTHKRCLYVGYTGRGKTKISLKGVMDLGGIILVTTPVSDTKTSFVNDLNNYHFSANRNIKTTVMDNKEFVKHSIRDLRRRADSGEVIVIILTVQDLRYGEDDTDDVDSDTLTLRAKYHSLSNNVTTWIRDERHLQYTGVVTNQRLSNIDAQYILDLTATPYNVMSEYATDEIINRSLLWGMLHRQHTNLPLIRIDAVGTLISNINSNTAALFSEEDGFDSRKLVARENDNFIYEAEWLEIRDRMYHSTFSKAKNYLSITNDTELSTVSKQCGLWVLPSGQNGDSAEDYIPALATLLRRASKTYFTDSYTLVRDCPKDMTIGDYVEHLVSIHGRVIILTCEKFLAGTDIPCLGHTVLFAKISNISKFEQLLGRIIRVYPGKNAAKMYCIAPGMEIGLTFGLAARANSMLGTGTVYEMAECIPLTEYTGEGGRSIGVENILNSTQDYFKRVHKNRLPSFSLQSELSTLDLSTLFKDVDLKNFKKSIPKTIITEENGARVKNKISTNPVTNTPITKEQRSIVELIEEAIQAIMVETKWVSYSNDNYEYSSLLNDAAIRAMFPDVIDPVYGVIENNTNIRNMVIKNLKDKELAYKGLPPEEVYDDIFLNNQFKRSLGLVYVPFDLAAQMVSKLPKKLNRKGAVILVLNALNGTFALELRKRFPKARIICAEFFDYFKNHLRKLEFEVVNAYIIEGKVHITGVDGMKFDCVIGNPPYQKKVGPAKTEPIWDKFVLKSSELLKVNGYLGMIHPAGWRNVDGRFTEVCDSLLSKQIEYLEIHNEKDGLKTFGANTRYDWYILQNVDMYKTTLVRFEDGKLDNVFLNELPFIPNHSLDRVKSLFAKEGEECVNVLYSRSAYGTDKQNVTDIKNKAFMHPVVYTVNINGEPTFKYSSINSNGHFGIPKVIWGNGATGFYIDELGEYGLTQFAYGIADSVENLPLIKKALTSPEFADILGAGSVTLSGINRKVLATFRKDFYKEFI